MFQPTRIPRGASSRKIRYRRILQHLVGDTLLPQLPTDCVGLHTGSLKLGLCFGSLATANVPCSGCAKRIHALTNVIRAYSQCASSRTMTSATARRMISFMFRRLELPRVGLSSARAEICMKVRLTARRGSVVTAAICDNDFNAIFRIVLVNSHPQCICRCGGSR